MFLKILEAFDLKAYAWMFDFIVAGKNIIVQQQIHIMKLKYF